MVRRGGRTTAPLSGSNNSSASSSNGSNQNGARWSRSRPNSANSGDINSSKGGKSFDSSRGSPNGSNQSTSVSPPVKKSNERGGKGRSSSNWRARGNGRNTAGATASDSKFSITNEDFPALPGAARSSSQSTPSKYMKKEKEASGRHGSTGSNNEFSVTDDSGVSSSSRGHTPVQDTIPSPIISTSIVKLGTERKKALLLTTENAKRKSSLPDRDRPPRSAPRTVRPVLAAPFASASPKKKSINAANSANTAPSFMKLSKLGQKIPERRGGTRVTNQSVPSNGPPSPSEDSGKENDGKADEESKVRKVDSTDLSADSEKSKLETLVELKIEPSPVVPIPSRHLDFSIPSRHSEPKLHQNYPDPKVPKIILGPDGEMSDIPASMLTDPFGMAAMLPILDIVKNKTSNADESQFSEKQMREKFLRENIEMTSIGIDLNELGVPIKTADNKSVWQSFAGPFGNEPLAPTSIGLTYYQVPSVYYTARTLMSSFDMSQNIPEKFGVHELFYIFYNLPKELWQLNAARELQFRGWRFHIPEKLWVHKMLGEPNECGFTGQSSESSLTQPGSSLNDEMKGIFEIYDPEKARITSREMVLKRSDFEIPAWEQRTLDEYQQKVASTFPKEVLWGPREDRSKMDLIPGMAGLVSAGGASRPTTNKLANLIIPKQQPTPRRLLSFVDSPDLTPSFDSPFGNLPPSSNEDLYRQQMYSVILQKMQQQSQLHQQQQQRQSVPAASFPSSSSASSFFQP